MYERVPSLCRRGGGAAARFALVLLALAFALAVPARPARAADDLAVGSASITDTLLTNFQTFTLSVVVSNNGTSPSVETPMRYYRSDDNSTATAGNDKQIGSDIVPALPSGGSSAEALTTSIPRTEATLTGLRVLIGDFWLFACVDPAGGGSSSANDCSTPVHIFVTDILAPELSLTIDTFEVSDINPTVGQTIKTDTEVTYTNAGAEPDPFEITLVYYLSTDSEIAPTDTQLGTDFLAIARNTTVAQSLNASIGVVGTYWLGACFEGDENSCTDGVEVTVEPRIDADLVITDFAAESASALTEELVADEAIGLSASVLNQGFETAGETEVRFYLSSDATISSSDTLLGAASIGALANGASASAELTTSIATDGDFWLGACAVAPSGEGITSNNCSAGLPATIHVNDTTKPSVSIAAPVNGAVLSQLTTISGTSADGETEIDKVELRISGGGRAVQNQGGQLEPGAPEWVLATLAANGEDWSYAAPGWVNDTVYAIEARATDASVLGGNERSVSHQFHYFNGDPRFTTLSLDPSTSSILFGGVLDVSMKLTDPSDLNADLSGSKLTVEVTDPDGMTETIGPFTTNGAGQVTLSGLGAVGNGLLGGGQDLRFVRKGTWTLRARFGGTFRLAAASSETELLLVGTSAGYAVIVEGRIANNEGLASHNKTANRIYRTLLARGFADQNIFYFNHDTAQDANQDGLPDNALSQAGLGVDFLPTKAGVRDLILGLAPVVNNNPAPVYVVFVDHGDPSPRFLLNDTEFITPANLNAWLNGLEGDLSAAALAEPRVVVVGTCYSGGFIPALSGPHRLIVTSAAADEESYKGPAEADTVRVGEYFLEEFFQSLERGQDIRSAFIGATAKTERYTRGGGAGDSVNQYFDDARQHPLLDDDGDGQGSNVLDVASSDGQVAAGLYLGTGPNHDVNAAENPADIDRVTETLALSNAETSADLFLDANFPAYVSQAYVEIRLPTTELQSSGGNEQLETPFIRRQMQPPATQGSKRFTLTSNDFASDTDKYEVYYYVQDVQTGELSPAKRSVVYRDLALNANQGPDGFNLLSPAAGATVKTVALFDWQDTTDQNDDDLTYTLIIGDDNNFDSFNGEDGPYRQEELTTSAAAADASAGLEDLATYWWKVEAVDIYGAATASSQARQFHTDNNNAPFGILKGIVYADNDFARLVGSQVRSIVGAFDGIVTAQVDGGYVMVLPPGLAQVIGSKAGYANQLYNAVQVPVSTVEQPFVSLNIAMGEDSDGDGMADDWEQQHGFDPNDPGDAEEDADGDGLTNLQEFRFGTDPTQADADADSDGDGMSNIYEIEHNFDPLNPADGALDIDDDGLSNLEELQAGTDPYDPDTDGDGASDGEEIDLGRNPLASEPAAFIGIFRMMLDDQP